MGSLSKLKEFLISNCNYIAVFMLLVGIMCMIFNFYTKFMLWLLVLLNLLVSWLVGMLDIKLVKKYSIDVIIKKIKKESIDSLKAVASYHCMVMLISNILPIGVGIIYYLCGCYNIGIVLMTVLFLQYYILNIVIPIIL